MIGRCRIKCPYRSWMCSQSIPLYKCQSASWTMLSDWNKLAVHTNKQCTIKREWLFSKEQNTPKNDISDTSSIINLCGRCLFSIIDCALVNIYNKPQLHVLRRSENVEKSKLSPNLRVNGINYRHKEAGANNGATCQYDSKSAESFHTNVKRVTANLSFHRQNLTFTFSARRYYSQETQTNQAFSNNTQSALFISRHDLINTLTVFADINIAERFNNLQNLYANINSRGMDHLNVYEMHSLHKELLEVHHRRQEIDSILQSLLDKIAELKDGEESDSESNEQIEELKSQVRDIRSELKPVLTAYKELEEELTLEALKLPNDLHQSTPEESIILEEVGEKPTFDFTPRDHVQLAEKTHTIVFSTISPGAHYLEGPLSDLQYKLECNLDEHLQEAGHTPLVCPDKVKAVILEGSGYDFTDQQRVFTIKKKQHELEHEKTHGLKKLDNTYHLTGVSPPAFNGYLSRVNLAESLLPLRYYSIGNCYTPRPLYTSTHYPSLLVSPQATVVELFGAGKDPEESELLYNEHVNIMKGFYNSVKLPIRYVQTGANYLGRMESLRLDTEVWMPSSNSYLKIGSVALWNDYASRRLMMKYSSKSAEYMNKNYVHTVHSTLVTMPVFIAALMENTQTKMGKFELPEELMKMLELK